MITVEMASPEKAGRHRFHELGICDDRFIPGLERLTKVIKAEGSVASIQLGHGGGHTSRRISGETPVAPSAIPHPVLEVSFENVIPEAMSRERIRSAVDAFAVAATRAFEAGFDVVEIHAAHGYLISQFLCPAENQRVDEYGGSLENRARFGLEVIRGIKRANLGRAVVFRFDSDDFFPGGLTPEESERLGIWAAEAGADALHVSGGHYRSLPSAERMIPPMGYPGGCFVPFASRLKRKVDVPIIVVGRLGDPKLAASIIEEGHADFVALARPLLADAGWVEKAVNGKPVRRCLACNTCVNDMRSGASLHCLVNPTAGREVEWAAKKTVRGKRIAVIGSGPAGLNYAILVAADNDVTVFERDSVPGGAFRIAGSAPMFQEVAAAQNSFDAYIADMQQTAIEAGVRFKFGCDPLKTPSQLTYFDHIVLATGASYRFGLGPLFLKLLRSGLAGRQPFRWMMKQERWRNWFYYRARKASGSRSVRRLPGGIGVELIGDTDKPGKSMEAIEAAFRAAHAPIADSRGIQTDCP
jgi:2,4-dienoyl-CoA reductase-like NADH-dependent reductase (Old Yellow Enzyme family)